MKIATNIYQEITKSEKEDIIDAFKEISDVEIFEFREKGIPIPIEEIFKFIFQDFDPFTIVRNGVVFIIFMSGIKKLWSMVKKKKPNSKVQGRIIFNSVNIILPNENIEEALESLPNLLETIKKEKAYWIIYKNGNWEITKL